MELMVYFILLVVGIVLVSIAVTQKKKDGNYNRRSRTLLNIGAVLITYSLMIKLPAFIHVVVDFWKGN